jgi:hypothetical protein
LKKRINLIAETLEREFKINVLRRPEE